MFYNFQIMDSENFLKTVMLVSANDCLKLASKYGGQVFGQYVTDVIVPLQKNPNYKVHFTKIHLWFFTSKDADNFISDAGDDLILVNNCYECYRFGVLLFKIKIFISNYPPCSDLNVNRLTYQYDGTTFYPRSYAPQSVEQLIMSIHNKSAIIDDDYFNLINNNHEEYQKLQKKYSDWSITFIDQPIFIQNDLSKYVQQCLCFYNFLIS